MHKVTVEIELEAERPSQRGPTLVAVGVFGPRIARVRASQQWARRGCDTAEFSLIDAHGVEVVS